MKKKQLITSKELAEEIVKLPLKLRAYRIIRKVLIAFTLASIVNLVFSYSFNTPKTYNLLKRNTELQMRYKMLNNRIDKVVDHLGEVRSRDVGMYRPIFGFDTTAVVADFNSSYRYDAYRENRFYPAITSTWDKLDAMARILYAETYSLDTLQLLAMSTEKMTTSVPAIWPVDRTRVRGGIGAYGNRVHPIYRRIIFHEGIDLGMNTGTPIYATAEGTVKEVRFERGYGEYVIIDHGFGYRTRYAHLSRSRVKVGQKVSRGELIASSGNTGQSTGPHLHYEVIYRGKTVNPINYLSKDMSKEEFEEIIKTAKSTTYEKDE